MSPLETQEAKKHGHWTQAWIWIWVQVQHGDTTFFEKLGHGYSKTHLLNNYLIYFYLYFLHIVNFHIMLIIYQFKSNNG